MFSLLAAQLFQAYGVGNLQQPAGEIPILKRTKFPMSQEEGFLSDLHGCFWLTQHLNGMLEDQILADQHQAVESLQVSLASALDQVVFIHQIGHRLLESKKTQLPRSRDPDGHIVDFDTLV